MGLRKKNGSDYDVLLAEERLILEATEAVVAVLDANGISRQELAQRMGKSKGFVSQLLSGERNMTLRTLADLGHALGCRFRVVPQMAADSAVAFHANVRPGNLLGAFAEYRRVAGVARAVISPEAVEESMRAAEANDIDSHEYALAA